MNTRLVEFRALVRLGLPLMAAQIFQMGQGFVDAVMAGRLSSADLAGITLGGSLMFPTMMLLSGILMAATPIIAQLNGAGRVPEVGEIVRQGLWLALAAATALVLFLWNAGPIYGWIGVDPLAAAIAVPYIRASCVGIPAIMCFFLFRYLCEGLGRTMPAMVIAGCALPLKVVLNYAFIYGELGAPELGGAGCGCRAPSLPGSSLRALPLSSRDASTGGRTYSVRSRCHVGTSFPGSSASGFPSARRSSSRSESIRSLRC